MTRFVVAVLLACLPPLSAFAAERVIAPRDTLSLRVVELRRDTGEPFEWEALAGEYVVGGAGAVQTPLAGPVPVLGLTAAEAGRAIATALKEAVGLAEAPSAAVQIVSTPPVYVAGRVEEPGEIGWRPGLTVLQAVALAGGPPRPEGGAFARFERDAVRARGQLRALAVSRDAQLARRARLRAEIDGAERIDFPDALAESDASEVKSLLREERLIFETRREGTRRRVAAFERLIEMLEEKIRSLRAQREIKGDQLALIEEDVESARKLVEKGLQTAGRSRELERSLAEYESRRIALDRSITDAEVRIAETEQRIIDLERRLRDEAAVSLRRTQDQLDRTLARIDTQRRLAREAELTAPARFAEAQAVRDGRAGRGLSYEILRDGPDGEIVSVPVSETDRLGPGDTLRVRMEPMAGAAAGAESSSGRGLRPDRAGRAWESGGSAAQRSAPTANATAWTAE